MKQFYFRYGTETIKLALDEKAVIGELYGKETPPISDISNALWNSLDFPIAHQPLHNFVQCSDLVTLIVSDMSRFWMRQDLVVPHIIAYLNKKCNIPDDNIAIVIACGTHAGGSENELRQLVTNDIYNRIAVINHNCLADDLVYLGTTSRGTRVSVNPLLCGRKVICLGAATQHVMAGFGGGRKSILPGVASMEAIRQNHAHSLDPLAPQSNPLIGVGILEGNPLHEDMCEAAAMVEHLFMINLVMNADMKLAYLFSGHWLYSWEEACRAATRIYQVPIEEKADVIITSCGGYPKDMSLYQGSKVIDNVESGLKPGGTLVLLMQCSEGGGAAEYFNWLTPLKAGTLDCDLRRNFTIPGYIFYLNCEQARRYRIIMLSDIDKEDVAAMGIEAFDKPEDLLAKLDLNGKKAYIIPNGSTVIPTLTESKEAL